MGHIYVRVKISNMEKTRAKEVEGFGRVEAGGASFTLTLALSRQGRGEYMSSVPWRRGASEKWVIAGARGVLTRLYFCGKRLGKFAGGIDNGFVLW